MKTIGRSLGVLVMAAILMVPYAEAQQPAEPAAPDAQITPAPDAEAESNPFAAPPVEPAPDTATPAQPAPSPGQQAVASDPFLPPPGMVTPPETLICTLGFFGHHPFVYSADNCFDLASAAYKCGYYEDAIALLSHAIEQEPQARYYYLRGMAQLQAGLASDAIASADGVLDAEAAGNFGGLDRIRERFNGPLGEQFRELLELRHSAR